MKTCSKCGTTKRVSEFYKHAGNRDGMQTACKACIKVASAAYYSTNKDSCKAAVAAWSAANRDKRKAAAAAWHASNRDHERERKAKWRSENPEKSRAHTYKWQAANPEAIRIYSHNRRARKRAVGGRLSSGLAAKLFKLQHGKCACGCKQPLGDDYHLDHRMPLALGGTNSDDNMQLLTATCNLKKGAKHPVDFMRQRGFLL